MAVDYMKQARFIPEKVREEVLFNPSFPALQNIPNSPTHPIMKLLFELYQDWLIPQSKSNRSFQLSCPFCRQRVMILFEQIWPSLVELHELYLAMNATKRT